MGTKTVPARPSELIILAINNLEEKDGSSSQDIVKFISQEFQMKPEEVTPRVQEALKRAMTYGIIAQKDGKYKIQDIPKQTQSELKDNSQDTAPQASQGDTKITNHNPRKRGAPKKAVGRKRKPPPKTRKNTKRVCRRCQSGIRYSEDN